MAYDLSKYIFGIKPQKCLSQTHLLLHKVNFGKLWSLATINLIKRLLKMIIKKSIEKPLFIAVAVVKIRRIKELNLAKIFQNLIKRLLKMSYKNVLQKCL